MQVGEMWAVACQLFMDLTQEQFLLEDRDWRSVTDKRGRCMPACSQEIRIHGNSASTKMRLDSYDKPTKQRVDSIWSYVGARPAASSASGVPGSKCWNILMMLRKKDAVALATTRESSIVDFVFVRQSKKTTPQDRRGHRETTLGHPGRELACNEIWLCGVGLGACILVDWIGHNDAVQVRNL
jgi:hypothetical protein